MRGALTIRSASIATLLIMLSSTTISKAQSVDLRSWAMLEAAKSHRAGEVFIKATDVEPNGALHCVATVLMKRPATKVSKARTEEYTIAWFILRNHANQATLGEALRRQEGKRTSLSARPVVATCYGKWLPAEDKNSKLPVFDCSPPEAPPIHKAGATDNKGETDSALLRFEQEQAEKGKDLYQYRMGMRYLNGNGVTNDLTKAREYLFRAAAQGNQDAAAELRKFSSQ